MAVVRYHRYTGELWDELDLESLVDELSDFLRQSGLGEVEGEWDEARKALEEARRIEPLTPMYHERSGDIAAAQGKQDEAVRAYETAPRREESAGLNAKLAMAYRRVGRSDQAVLRLMRAMKLGLSAPGLRDTLEAWSRTPSK